jgi:DNA helicase-2/ATP-dependent DNA helicase PcrA
MNTTTSSPAINLLDAFRIAVSKLNAAQREAVETIEGPVMVIAGPGTGKTQILAARVGNILLQTQSNPENILCLTYTDAGVIAMRNRLIEFIGPAAYRVPVHTFHSFCNQIIQENRERFGVNELDVLSDLEAAEIFREMVDEYPAQHPLKKWSGQVYSDKKKMLELFALMKKEDLTAESIREKVDAYVDQLHQDPANFSSRGPTKGQLLSNVQKTIDGLAPMLAAAGEFTNFQRRVAARGRYTFDDMILWVLRAFESDPQFLLRYQERFQYFLVDEFQDTNGAQYAIFRELISYYDAPNAFVVGDDDQSIYRFQGASIENLHAFRNRYRQHLKLIALKENYRSSQNILDTATALISINLERIANEDAAVSKTLHGVGEYASSEVKPEVVCYNTPVAEAAGVAMAIEQQIKAGVPAGEIAVIYARHRHSSEIEAYLKAHQIPFAIRRPANIFQLSLTKRIIKLMEYAQLELNKPFSGEHLLFELLHFDFFGLNPALLSRLSLNMRGISGINYRRLIADPAQFMRNDLFTDPGSIPQLAAVSKALDQIISALPNATLVHWFEMLTVQAGILRHIMQHPEKVWLMQELTTFMNFIKEETHRNPYLDLPGLLDRIRLMKEEEIPLAFQKFTYEENAVTLVTAHSAKGLEFHSVYMIGCNRDSWEKARNNHNSYSYPPNLIAEAAADPMEEHRRLFYVGMTRAKEMLAMSYVANKPDGKPLEPSQFITEVRMHPLVSFSAETEAPSLLADFVAATMQQPLQPRYFPDDLKHIRQLVSQASLSVTALNTYLRCPLSYYYNNLLRVPCAPVAVFEFGSAVHEALEYFFNDMVKNGKIFPPPSVLVEYFEKFLASKREVFTPVEFQRRLEYGRIFLPQYFDHYHADWNRNVSIERRISGVEISGVPVTGRFDKIEFEAHGINIVDYKTGKLESARKKFYRPGTGKPSEKGEYVHGGDYWRQAVFYKLIADNYRRENWNITSAEFDFVEPDRATGQFEKVRVRIEPGDADLVRGQIVEAWKGIQSLSFPGCNDEKCEWCAFAKMNFTTSAVPVDGEE